MADDFFNGLDVVPLPPGDHWLRSASTSPAEHPFRPLVRVRASPPAVSTRAPESVKPPATYSQHSLLRAPAEGLSKMSVRTQNPHGVTEKSYTGGEVEVHETVRLQDVEAFRMKTSEATKRVFGGNGNDMDRQLSERAARMRIAAGASPRPVIYRYADVIKNGLALLEAIHFELFLPDRADLRFLAVPIATVPQTAEGDYFHVMEADLMERAEFGVKLGKERDAVVYPVVWEARAPVPMVFSKNLQREQHALAYVLKKKQATVGGDLAISILHPGQFLLRSSLFADQEDRRPDSLLRVSMRSGAAAHLYPVEPPIPPTMEGGGGGQRGGAPRGLWGAGDDQDSNGAAAREPDSYIARVRGVRTSAPAREGRVVSKVRALTDNEEAKLNDRFGEFREYNKPGDVELMHELFRLGCRFREVESNSGGGKDAAADAGDMRIDESVILKALLDDSIPLNRARLTLDAVYGHPRRDDPVHADPPAGAAAPRAGDLRLNAEQARALHYYTMDEAPRVFCILSPPGSGKTTVAAAMAAAVAKNVREAPKSFLNRNKPTSGGEVQLLLSVQNVAVDNMGAALKKMEYGGGLVYNMKSTTKLDPHHPAPFDFLDLAGEDSLKGWRALRGPMDREKRSKGKKYEKEKKVYEDQLTTSRREYERNLSPKVVLSTVEMVLQKMFTKSKLCEALEKVTRVIIDEASLLTEAALFCLMRRFPEAQMVLIGDDKQLPPFMYDERLIGSELAGRPALTVAMRTGKVPVVKLVEVYRAPQSLVAPYNRLAYGNKLRSNVPHTESPLSVLGLVHHGMAQLLFVEVEGIQEREEKSMSLYNEKELKAAQRLLAKFPKEMTPDVMIICLYKEQKRRLQAALGNDYNVLTVDSAQGKEKPIVVLLTTRTVIPKEGQFFYSKERCNVSISRQQKALIVLGFPQLLTTNKPWSTVVNEDDFTRIKALDIKQEMPQDSNNNFFDEETVDELSRFDQLSLVQSDLPISLKNDVDEEFENFFNFLGFPNEIVKNVFFYLDMKTRFRARLTKRLRDIEAECKYYVTNLFIVDAIEEPSPEDNFILPEYNDEGDERIVLSKDKPQSYECLRKISRNTSILTLSVKLSGSDEFYREAYNIIKEFDMECLYLNFKDDHESMVDSLFLDVSKICGYFNVAESEHISAEAIHEVYRNLEVEDSMKLRAFTLCEINRETCFEFLGMIGITLRDGRYVTEEDTVFLRGEFLCPSFFYGSLEITFSDNFHSSTWVEMRIDYHRSIESVEAAIQDKFDMDYIVVGEY